MAPNQVEDGNEASKPSNKTAETDNSVDTSKQKSEPEQVDYKVKFTESQKEALRLREENQKYEEERTQWQDVADVINSDPELMSKIQNKYDQKYGSNNDTGVVSEKVIEAKVQEKMKPIQSEVQNLQRQQVEQAVKTFSQYHPDAAEGTERWQKIMNYLPAMSAAKLPLVDGMEKAYKMVLLDEAESSGKTDVLRDMFTKTQAAAGGGSSGSASRQPVEAELTAQEKKAAARFGMTPKEYAEWKNK